MNYADMINASFRKGYTYRVYPGGKRMMVHRWDYQKVKGSRPLREAMIENITRGNPLLDALMRKGK